MNKKKWVMAGLIAGFVGALAFPARIEYAEQFYRLYHLHLNRYAQNSAENIWYLSKALQSPFANPLNAIAIIKDKKEWEKYRHLFRMHVALKIIDEYLSIASKYDKFNAYFYNYPWKSANIDSLRSARRYYNLALDMWDMAEKSALEARNDQFHWIHLEEIQYWEDEAWRIETHDLNYKDIIEAHLKRLDKVVTEFESMDYQTY